MNKRDFIKYCSLLAGGTLLNIRPGNAESLNPHENTKKKGNGRLTLRFSPYTLQLKHTFTLATSSRTTTPVILTEIEYEGVTGYGEASMPPYLGESQESVSK